MAESNIKRLHSQVSTVGRGLILFTVTILLTFFLASPTFSKIMLPGIRTDSLLSVRGGIVAVPFLIAGTIRSFSDAYVPDEANFVHIAAAQPSLIANPVALFTSPNLEGFGGFFWGILTLGMHLAGDSNYWSSIASIDSMDFRQHLYDFDYSPTFLVIVYVRIIAVLFVSFWLWLFSSQVLRQGRWWWTLPGLAISFPMFWWAGKMGSPEMMAAALTGIAVITLLKNKLRTAAFIAGLAVGFKVSAGPVVALVILAALVIQWRSARARSSNLAQSTLLAGLFGAGWLSINIYSILDYAGFAANARRLTPDYFGGLRPTLPLEIWHAWSTPDLSTWDYVTTSGLFFWTGSGLALFVLLALLSFQRRWATELLFMVGLIATTYLLIVGQAVEFPWYYFPAIFAGLSLCITPLSDDRLQKAAGLGTKIIAVFAIGAVLVGNIYSSQKEIASTSRYRDDIVSVSTQTDCIQRAVNTYGTQYQLIDTGAIGRAAAPPLLSGDAWDAELWNKTNSRTPTIFIRGFQSRAHQSLSWTGLKVSQTELCGDISVDILEK